MESFGSFLFDSRHCGFCGWTRLFHPDNDWSGGRSLSLATPTECPRSRKDWILHWGVRRDRLDVLEFSVADHCDRGRCVVVEPKRTYDGDLSINFMLAAVRFLAMLCCRCPVRRVGIDRAPVRKRETMFLMMVAPTLGFSRDSGH